MPELDFPHIALTISFRCLSQFLPGQVEEAIFDVSTAAGTPIGAIRGPIDVRDIDHQLLKHLLRDRDDEPYPLIRAVTQGRAHVFRVGPHVVTARYVGLAGMYGVVLRGDWKASSPMLSSSIIVQGPQQLMNAADVIELERSVEEQLHS